MRKRFIVLSLLSVFLSLAVSVAIAQTSDVNPEGETASEKNYCADCHSKLRGTLMHPVEEWRGSVHAQTGNNCNICHGGNSGINNRFLAKSRKYKFIGKPDKRMITDFCGRGGCHSLALEQFKRGPHYASVLKTNQPNCTSCHGVHNIQRSSIDLITHKSCTSCHPAEYSRDIITLIGDIDKRLGAIDKNVFYLNAKYADVKDLEKRLDDARHLFHQFVHVFSREDMRSTKKILELEIRNLDTESLSKVAMVKRLDMLYIAMIIFGLMIIAGIGLYTILMYSKRRQ